MSKNIKIDEKELVKQMKETALKKPNARLEMIVAEGENNPICELDVAGVTPKEVALLYLGLEEMRKVIERGYPTAVEYANKTFKLRGSTKIELDD